jgi:hypothetical protein
MRRNIAILSAMIFSALPFVGVAFGWSAFEALTLLCADIIILLVITGADILTRFSPPKEPRLGRIFAAAIMVFFVAGVLATNADGIVQYTDLGIVLARSEMAAAVMLVGVGRLVEYAIVAALPSRPWRTSRFLLPVALFAVGFWCWRPDEPTIYLLLMALCIAKATSELAEIFHAEADEREASWQERANEQLGDA